MVKALGLCALGNVVHGVTLFGNNIRLLLKRLAAEPIEPLLFLQSNSGHDRVHVSHEHGNERFARRR